LKYLFYAYDPLYMHIMCGIYYRMISSHQINIGQGICPFVSAFIVQNFYTDSLRGYLRSLSVR